MALAPRSRRPMCRSRRTRSHRVLVVLLAATLLVSAPRCGGTAGGDGALLVSTADLWAAPARYEGRRVRVTGVVLGFSVGAADEHYVIEGPGQHRVALRGVEHTRLATMQGHRVETIGRFHFSEQAGFAIDVETIRVVG